MRLRLLMLCGFAFAACSHLQTPLPIHLSPACSGLTPPPVPEPVDFMPTDCPEHFAGCLTPTQGQALARNILGLQLWANEAWGRCGTHATP